MKTTKKGIELNQAMGAIVTLILVALLIIVSMVIFTSMNTATATAGTTATSINETLGTPTTAGMLLTTGANARDGVCGAVTKIYIDSTGNVRTGVANITQVGCRVYNNSGSGDWVTTFGDADTRMTYTYTYTAETSASNASTSMASNFSGYPALVGLVGTIIFLALVIGVLVASFAFGSNKGV